ncbi:MAG: hypothetical protein NVSMB19_25220 [Vulcanimicrobiaceae bacterium]
MLCGLSVTLASCSVLRHHKMIPPTNPSPTAIASGTPIATPVPIRSLAPGASASPATAAPLFTASPTPIPTAAPTGASLANAARPFHNGDVYAYAGQTLQTFVYAGASPRPMATTLFAIAQNVAVTDNATYNGISGAFDFKTSETDTSPLQQIGITNDTYYTTTTVGAFTNVVTLGYTSTTTTGEKLAVTVTNPGAGNGLIDILPEQGQQTWTNTGAQRIAISQADGFTSVRTYAADGTYTDTANYPQAGAANPQATPLVATIVTRADGTATYSLPLFGPPNVTIAYGAPANGAIPISITQPGTTPGATPAPIQTALVGTWYQTPLRLYDELDRDNGAVPIPASCKVPSSPYGTQANEIEQRSVRTDTALGTLDSFDQLTFVVPTYGVVCVVLTDTVLTYYDYTGQGNGAPTGVSYSGGNSPLQTTTLATTIGLTSATIRPFSVGSNGAGGDAGLRLASARANFLATVERQRVARQRFAIERLRKFILEGSKR